MNAVGRLDAFQRRHRWAAFGLAVVYKFFDDQGNYLAALIAYYGFLSLFPLLLLLVTLLGYVLSGNPHLQEQIVHSALAQFPIVGPQLGDNVESLQGNAWALAIGVIGCLYGGLGVAQAAQNAMNKIWAVPRNTRPNPLAARARSLALIAVAGVGVLLTTGLSALSTATWRVTPHGPLLHTAGAVLAVVVNALLFLTVFRILTARDVSVRQVRVGAVAAALAWQALQESGAYFVAHELRGARSAYGVFGLVLGLLAWIYLSALVVVVCAEINSVRADRLWPRSLLTPFTDNVRLTAADESAYTAYAETERHKGFEKIDVSFDDAPDRREPP